MQKTVKKTALLALIIAALILLAACGRGDREEPTPTPTKTPAAAEAPAAATATPVPAQPVAEAPTPEPAEAAPVEPTATPVEEKQVDVATVSAIQLNVRAEPNTSGDIVGLINQGESFPVLARSDDGQWVQLADNDQPYGWVAAEYVTITTQTVSGDEPVAKTDPPADDDPAPQPAPPGSGNYLPATMSNPDFGSQAFLWWRDEVGKRDLDLLRDGGFGWVKQAFAWETIEGAGKGQYDWSIADRVVRDANDRGLKVLARLSTDPELTKFWGGAPPGNADDFAQFAGTVAARYNCTPQAVGCIQAFQVWNEPNLAREWGGNRPNPAQYSDFLRKSYARIKAGNPNAIVISAGMAPTGDNNEIAMPDDIFYDGMYQAMGGNSDGYFDMLGVHGAGFAAPPELDPGEAASNSQYGGYRFFAFRHVEDIRDIMVRYGDTDKKIVLLEFGWTFDPVNPSYKWHGADAGIDMFVQADYLKRAYQWAAANWQPWIGLMSLLTMPNLDWTNDGNVEDEEQYWWAIMEPSQINELKWRPGYIELCIYFNGVKGQLCKYDPN